MAQSRRIPWHQYFMLQALVIAQRSTCNRALVGSILVRDNRMIASGYNGSVKGEPHCDDVGHLMVDGHCVRTIHSEINALLQCAKIGISTTETTLYVTHFPCFNCSKCLAQAGIQHIRYYYDYRVDPYAQHLLEQVGISTEKVTIDPPYLQQLWSEITQESEND